MIYIFIHIIIVAVFSSMYKYAALKKAHIPTCKFLMYSSAAAASAAGVLCTGRLSADLMLISLGVTAGVFMVTTIWAFFKAIEQGGLAIGWTFISLSIVLPVTASIIFWKEIPSLWQVLGFVLLVPCILLFGNLDLQVEGNRKRWAGLITLSALTTGTLMIVAKGLGSISLMDPLTQEEKIPVTLTYLFYAYVTGGVIMGAISFRNRMRFGKHEFITGISMGLLNVVANWALLTALLVLPGIIVFPLKGGFGVMMTALIAVFFFKEKITRRQIIGILFGIVCVVLVNIR